MPTDAAPGDPTHRQVVANDVRLHYVEAGPDDGPPVVLLHGFPDHWYTWRRQLPALADAGFRVVAPDMRGYNRSEKPHGVGAYRLPTLADDVAALVRTLEANAAHVVGHDWGGVVAWATALSAPAVVDRLVVLNAPHPTKYAREMTVEQALRSWYAVFFQVPWLPEAVLAARDFAAVERLYRAGTADPEAFTDADVRRVKRALSRPGALESALDYYRALFPEAVRETVAHSLPVGGGADPVERIEAPTLVCWGERDAALSVEQTEGLDRYVETVRVERFPEAGHWVHVDAAEAVTDAVIDFLGERG